MLDKGLGQIIAVIESKDFVKVVKELKLEDNKEYVTKYADQIKEKVGEVIDQDIIPFLEKIKGAPYSP